MDDSSSSSLPTVASPLIGTPPALAVSFPRPYSTRSIKPHLVDFRTSLENLSQLKLKESPRAWANLTDCRCTPVREGEDQQNNIHMSQRHAASAHDNLGRDGSSLDPLEPSTKRKPILPPITAPSPQGSPKMHHGQIPNGRSSGAPTPLQMDSPAMSTASSEPQAPRLLKMHAILNPTGASEEQIVQRSSVPPDVHTVRSTADSSPASSNGPLTPGRPLPPMMGLSSPYVQNLRQTAGPGPLGGRGPGMGPINQPTGTIDAKQSPFLSSNTSNHIYALGVDARNHSYGPHGATPPTMAKINFTYSQQAAGRPEGRRGSDATSQVAPSQSNSPTTSYSSHGQQSSRTSPASHFVQSTTQPPTSNYYGKGGSGPQITLGTDSTFTTSQNGQGQSTYQLITLDTDQGPIQVPVDVQAASKVADEKRKRNAGASARFRQRRKEKEREASQMIAKLESKVREINEEREYYRLERDYFRGLVYNSPAQAHVTPRLPSPRQRKLSPSSTAGTTDWQQNGERGSDDGRNQRRRISGYFEGPSSVTAPATVQSSHPQYPSSTPYSYGGQDSRSQTPHDRPALAGPPPLRVGHYDPPAPAGYERSWNPSRA